jgi:hypothetical protein
MLLVHEPATCRKRDLKRMIVDRPIFFESERFLPLTDPGISVSLTRGTGESYLEFSSKYLGGKQLSKFNYSPVLLFFFA